MGQALRDRTRGTRLRLGAEKELLLTFLDRQREVVLWKLDGLTDDQLRQRPLGPSSLYLLGLVKRVAGAEQYWLSHMFGPPAALLSLAAEFPTAGEWRSPSVEDERVRPVLLEQGPRHQWVGDMGHHGGEFVAQ
jgi:hypothetical protein